MEKTFLTTFLSFPIIIGIIFIAGSETAPGNAYMFEVDTGEIVFDSSLPNPRNRVACGVVESPLGGYDVVIAGGTGPSYVQTLIGNFLARKFKWISLPAAKPSGPRTVRVVLVRGGGTSLGINIIFFI